MHRLLKSRRRLRARVFAGRRPRGCAASGDRQFGIGTVGEQGGNVDRVVARVDTRVGQRGGVPAGTEAFLGEFALGLAALETLPVR